jgi:hypothetical protein
VARNENRDEEQARYGVKVWVNRGEDFNYFEEQFFAERPDRDMLVMLLEDAKNTFRALYPGGEPNDFSVNVVRLRPADDFRPDLSVLADDES